jgi:hypothetical protein
VPVLAFLTWLAGKALVARHERRLACGYEYQEGDVQWDDSKVWTYSMYVGVGAIAAGMLGVGGGMILGPIFNELEFLPQVSSATSTIMVFFMSSANVGQFVVFGMLDMEYALFYGSVGIVGAVVGTKGAKSILDRTGRASYAQSARPQHSRIPTRRFSPSQPSRDLRAAGELCAGGCHLAGTSSSSSLRSSSARASSWPPRASRRSCAPGSQASGPYAAVLAPPSARATERPARHASHTNTHHAP